MVPLELRFAPDMPAMVEIIHNAVARGGRQLRIEPASAAPDFLSRLPSGLREKLHVQRQDHSSAPPDLVVIPVWDDDEVAASLMRCLDLESGLVIAPLTSRHSSQHALFLISIPKAGTHLLFRLAKALGYHYGGVSPPDPKPGQWYAIENHHHTRATAMFGDILNRPGNIDHPFLRSPALFIYRDPRDILVSEANFYHRPEVSIVSGYFAGLSFRERLIRLLNDPWLIGTLRDRMAVYIAWFSIRNVIPVSFEELVGAAGGGSDDEQRRLIWSVQLKLQAGGQPDVIARDLYDRASPTFHTGQIGSWRQHFDRTIQRLFAGLHQDFMAQMGYNAKARTPYSVHRGKFRRRPLYVAGVSVEHQPILVESLEDFNIVHFRRRYFALPYSLGTLNLETLPEANMTALISDTNLDRLRTALQNMALHDGDGSSG